MTIASAFNDLAVAQGGTADSSGTIAGAIDALTDALAGSDIPEGRTIEDNVKILGEHLSGGGGFDYGKQVFISVANSCDVMIAADADLSKVMFNSNIHSNTLITALADMYFIYNATFFAEFAFGITENEVWSETLTPDAILTVEEDIFNCYKLRYLDSEDKAYEIRYFD